MASGSAPCSRIGWESSRLKVDPSAELSSVADGPPLNVPLHSRLVVCSTCGLTCSLPELAEGHAAVCPRCRETLRKRCRADWERVAALATAACIALVVALSGMFLGLRSAGGDNAMTLLGASARLAEQRLLLGIIVGLLFVGFPAALAMGLTGLSFALLGRRIDARWAWFAKRVSFLQTWSMADVFIVGILVSLTKIASIARVEYGWSFWAFGAFALLLAGACASFDARRALDEISERKRERG